MNRIDKKEKLIYIAVGVILVAALSILMSVRVQSRSREAVLFDNSSYAAAEEIYKQQVREVLESYDCYNSGLTMTRVVSLEGERQYSIRIYNSRIQKLGKSAYESLHRDLAECAVVLPDGSEYKVNLSMEI